MLINAFPVHPFIEGSAVIKNSVQNHLHPTSVQLFYQSYKKLIAGLKIIQSCHTVDIACGTDIILFPIPHQFSFITDDLSEMRVNIIVILNIILVVGRGDKKGIKINHLHPQVLKVIQLVHHALEVTAVKFPHTHVRRYFVPILHLMGWFPYINIFFIQHIISLVPIAKTVCKNLVHDGAFCPIRCGKSRRDTKRLALLQVSGYTTFVVKTSCLSVLYLKIIVDRLRTGFDLDHIIVETAFRKFQFHLFF